ncbi:MAG: hypothetical protein ACPGXX_00850, partial [Planctomycetaceae bacterium]
PTVIWRRNQTLKQVLNACTKNIKLQAGEIQACRFCERDQIPLQDFAFESNRRAVKLFLQQS